MKLKLKLMWLPDASFPLFDMQTNEVPSLSKEEQSFIREQLSLDTWVQSFTQEYAKWLNDEDNQVHDIHSELNAMMIRNIEEANKLSDAFIIYYWFDIDRYYVDDFHWQYCPISGNPLIDLGENYHSLNRLISPDFHITFPVS